MSAPMKRIGGYLYIVDRLKDMIITGGENVYSREVEEVLYTRPEIQECAVIGLPDRELGERVAAFITLKPGASLDKEGLRAFLKSRLHLVKWLNVEVPFLKAC